MYIYMEREILTSFVYAYIVLIFSYDHLELFIHNMKYIEESSDYYTYM